MPASSSIADATGWRSRRRDFSQVIRNTEADRYRDQHRNERRHQGSVDRHQRAKLVIDRIPITGPEKFEPKGAEGEPASHSMDSAAPLSDTNTKMPATATMRRKTLSEDASRRDRDSSAWKSSAGLRPGLFDIYVNL